MQFSNPLFLSILTSRSIRISSDRWHNDGSGAVLSRAVPCRATTGDDCGCNFPVRRAPPVCLTFAHSSLTHQHQQPWWWVAKGEHNGADGGEWRPSLSRAEVTPPPCWLQKSSLGISTCRYIIPAASRRAGGVFTSFFFFFRLHFEGEMRCNPVGVLKERNIAGLPSHPRLEIPFGWAPKEGTKCKGSTGR